MQMLNRAIEDAAAFEAFQRALTQRNPDGDLTPRSGNESRAQRRARERAERKAASKAQPKVKA